MAFGDFTVTRSTVKRVLNSSGVLAEVAINTPAFEFNADGTYRGLLVEPAGTNGIRNNTNVGAVLGVLGSGGSLPTNWAIATFGLTREVTGISSENGVDYLELKFSGTATSGGTFDIAFESNTQIVATASQAWTNSFWVKLVSGTSVPSNFYLSVRNATAAGTLVSNSQLSFTPTSVLSRFSYPMTTPATTERVNPRIQFDVTNGATYDFTVRIGLPQMEQSSVATSVIKTSGTSLTRTADSVTLTGASSLIGQTEGTLYAEVEYRGTKADGLRFVQISDGTDNNRILLLTNGAGGVNGVRIVATVGGVSQAGFSSSTSAYTGIVKAAIAYALDDYALYVNGTAQGTDTSGTIPACNRVDIGQSQSAGNQFNGHIRSVALFPTRLANATLATLTT